MRHFQGLVRLDSTDPPGNETRVAEYVKKVLEAEGFQVTVAAKDPARANVIARIKGNGAKTSPDDHGSQRHRPRRRRKMDLSAV